MIEFTEEDRKRLVLIAKSLDNKAGLTLGAPSRLAKSDADFCRELAARSEPDHSADLVEHWMVDYENAEGDPQHAVLSWISPGPTRELPEAGTELVRLDDYLRLAERPAGDAEGRRVRVIREEVAAMQKWVNEQLNEKTSSGQRVGVLAFPASFANGVVNRLDKLAALADSTEGGEHRG